MKRSTVAGFVLLAVISQSAVLPACAEKNLVEEALSEVRDTKADMFSRKSSVLGQLPSPAEMATHQMRCRPFLKAKAGVQPKLKFDSATSKRAAELSPAEFRKRKTSHPLLPLGITGAFVGVFIPDHTELLVVGVLDDAPAAGILREDDLIIGANGRLFVDVEDPRPEMGYALVESQSPQLKGILTLHLVRDRRPLTVEIDLDNALSYSPTWPFNCKKSEQILQDAVDLVIASHPVHRYNFWTRMFLMASGDERAMELARRTITASVKPEYQKNKGASAWVGGYQLQTLCEYYLLTGDSIVLPAIYHQAQGLAHAQFRSGSWSHGGSAEIPGTAGGGYGEINNAGLGAFIGLNLARQCGIEPYDHTIPRSIRYFGKYCGSNLGYGLGTPGGRSGSADNGVNGEAAVAFHLLGEREMAERWARTVCYMWMGREHGHAESIFSCAWGPVSANLAPKEEFHMFMNQQLWAYELGRNVDGGLTFMRGGRWSYPNATAAMGLGLCLPKRRLQILGAEKSVFAMAPPCQATARAAELYKTKQWIQLRKALDGLIRGNPASGIRNPKSCAYAKALLAAYNRYEQHAAATHKLIAATIEAGDKDTAFAQLDALQRFLGEERPQAARLRESAAALKPGKRGAKTPPTGERAALLKEWSKGLELGFIDGGFVHSGGYMRAANMHGFEGMPSEKVAGYLGHFAGGPADGAVHTFAAQGEKVVPLLKRLLTDSHYGVRAGAMSAITEIYKPESPEYRTDVSPELAELIKLVRPLMNDESVLVRSAVSAFITNLRVLNEDVYEMLYKLARTGADLDGYARWGIKDPVARVKLCMLIVENVNERRNVVPAAYKPLAYAASAHMDKCGPYVQLAIDTLRNPEVMSMYGFFSNNGSAAAMDLLSYYAHDPLVLQNLSAILRYAVLRASPGDHYFGTQRDCANQIVLKLGPKSFRAVEKYLASEPEVFRRILAGEDNRPQWGSYVSLETLDEFAEEMAMTMDVARCLHGQTKGKEAMDVMCRTYLANRLVGGYERQLIRDRITELGRDAVPMMLKAVDEQLPSINAEVDKHIADKKAALVKAEAGKSEKSRELGPQIKKLEKQKEGREQRVADLKELASLIEAFDCAKPTDDAIALLCSFYIERPLVHGPLREVGVSARPGFAMQTAMVRDTLQRWGKAALPAMNRWLASDEQLLAKTMAELDEEEAAVRKTHRHTVRLAAVLRAKEDTQAFRAELRELATVMACASRTRLSDEELGELCRIYTRRAWPTQQQKILEMLTKSEGADKVIRRHVQTEREALPGIQTEIMALRGNTAKGARLTIPYNKLLLLRKNIEDGTAKLADLLSEEPPPM